MNLKHALVILLTAFIHSYLLGQSETYFLQTKVEGEGQSETYSVNKASFSTDKYDEFSPVTYKNGIVFCSNRAATKIMSYSTEDNKGLIKITFFDALAENQSQSIKFFSKQLNSKFNDGPVTFNSKGDTIYYSRNILVDGKLSELSTVRNKLGIFYAVYDGNEWTKIREVRINNEWYNVTTPWLSPNGKRLYFASDKPGGYGGSDLYYCQWKNDYWDEPVNLGPVINTKGNESYPFINVAGEFFFSSDGHPGLGGKDIFFSRYSDTSWIAPVPLDAPVNSQSDDFGISTDTLMSEGYFSSNRDKSIDIFHFRTVNPQIFYSTPQKENNYCFVFRDSGAIIVDTVTLQQRWSFGDGTTDNGSVVRHCFPGPGKYTVRLDIIERETGRLFFTKLIDNLELKDFEQPYINAPVYAVKGDNVSFDGYKSYIPGFSIVNFSWDFGDKIKSGGAKVTHSYLKNGEYVVNLELALKSDLDGSFKKAGISRKIIVFNDKQESNSFQAGVTQMKNEYPDARKSANLVLKSQFSAEEEFHNDGEFCIELMSSPKKIELMDGAFRNVPGIYMIKERLDSIKGEYSYTVDQQMSLMATYPVFRKMASLGFKDAKIKIFRLTRSYEKELHNFLRVNGTLSDIYFDSSDRLTSNAFIMLDQITRLMNKYPSLRLEVAVHTDNSASPESSIAVSQKRAQLLVDYLINRGVKAKRLVSKGYGAAKPIASNLVEKGRKLNRRIDFTIIE